jgi:hypothetical protein
MNDAFTTELAVAIGLLFVGCLGLCALNVLLSVQLAALRNRVRGLEQQLGNR